MDNNDDIKNKITDSEYVWEVSSCFSPIKELKEAPQPQETVEPPLWVVDSKLDERNVSRKKGYDIQFELEGLCVPFFQGFRVPDKQSLLQEAFSEGRMSLEPQEMQNIFLQIIQTLTCPVSHKSVSGVQCVWNIVQSYPQGVVSGLELIETSPEKKKKNIVKKQDRQTDR